MWSYWKIVLIVVCAGFCVAAFQTFGMEGLRPSPATIGEMVGRGLALALIPLLIALPMNFFKRRKSPVRSSGPLVTGLAVFAVCSVLATIGLEADQADDWVPVKNTTFEYVGKGCDLAIDFPAEPKLTPVKVAGMDAKGEQAAVVWGDAYFRAETMPFPKGYELTTDTIGPALEAFVLANGLQNATVTTSEEPFGVMASARGGKVLQGVQGTFEVRMIGSGLCMLSVVTIGEAAGYPQAGIIEFQRSVHKAAPR
jgi:hypothetical protein